MILERYIGEYKGYSINTSLHTNSSRKGNNIIRDSLSKSKYISLIAEKFIDYPKNGSKFVITWEHKESSYKGLLVSIKDKDITIITTVLTNDKNPDKILQNENVRFNLGKVNFNKDLK